MNPILLFEVHLSGPFNLRYTVKFPVLDKHSDYHFLAASAVWHMWKDNHSTNLSEDRWDNLAFQVFQLTEDKYGILVPGEFDSVRSIYGKRFNNKLERI